MKNLVLAFFNLRHVDSVIRRAEIIGEFWIDSSGMLLYADGDVGDYNHEMYATQQLLSEILEYFGINEVENLDIYSYYPQIKSFLSPERLEEFEESPDTVIFDILKEHGYPNVEDAYKVIYGRKDPREYALKHWGWKRVHGNNIQTMFLTESDLRIISRALGELLQTEEDENETFTIEVYSTHNVYDDVPLNIIDSGDVSRLIEYRRY